MRDARDRLAERLGVVPVYMDATGRRHDLSPESRDAMLRAMDAPDDEAGAEAWLAKLEAEPDLPVWTVVEADAPVLLPVLEGRDWRLTREDGTGLEGHGGTLDALPLGIHRLECDGARTWVLSAPPRLPEPPRAWGVTLPLYGISGDGRIGTYRDLARACGSLGAAGADFVGVNPVHAGFPTDPSAFSPYAPAHRGRLAAIHVAPEDEPPLPAQELLDWSVALPSRLEALRRDPEPEGFDAWAAGQGPDLWRFALHQALSERFGPAWPSWPDTYHDPEGDAAQAFARDNADAVRFHAVLQFRADSQLEEAQSTALAAGMRFGLYLDLAVGTHPHGAETWGQPGLFAHAVSLGAPPDAFSPGGQSWGLAPLRPDALARDGFRALARILRRALSHAKLLRIDHILGFERAFWVPEDGTPGAYVRMPRDGMLAVARIEAARAGATIVGEDLGNIPEGLGAALESSGILGCRVAQFEQHWDAERVSFRPAEDYARGVLTSFGSHDLPTWAGWRAGRDIDWRARLDNWTAEDEAAARARRADEVWILCEMLGGDGIDALHGFLARTPSRLLVCQIEDLEGRVEQPNLPGTVFEHPNWRRRVDTPAGMLGQLDAVARTAMIMRDADR